jgi:hypothetical protein
MGRKPVGEKAMTDAERQRRRREKLRGAATSPSVTELSRNEEPVDERLRKRNEWLERENKRLRKDARDWRDYGLEFQKMAECERQEHEKSTARLDDKLDETQRELRRVQAELHELKMEQIIESLKPMTLKKWIRELTMRYHPDRGGSQEQMKVVNHAYDLLKQLLDQQQPRG